MERIQRRVMKVVEEREAVYGVYISDTHGMCVSVVEREREREEFVCVCVCVCQEWEWPLTFFVEFCIRVGRHMHASTHTAATRRRYRLDVTSSTLRGDVMSLQLWRKISRNSKQQLSGFVTLTTSSPSTISAAPEVVRPGRTHTLLLLPLLVRDLQRVFVLLWLLI